MIPSLWNVVAIVVSLASIATTWREVVSYRRLRRLVFADLDDALESGQFRCDGYLYGMSTTDIAYDLACYAADLEPYSPRAILPHVIAWEKSRSI